MVWVVICDPSRPDLQGISFQEFKQTAPPADQMNPFYKMNACYEQAAFASATQMMRERKKRRATQGLPPLSVGWVTQNPGENWQAGWISDDALRSACLSANGSDPHRDCLAWLQSTEEYWRGDLMAISGGGKQRLDYLSSHLSNADAYEGDYSLSLRQFRADDEAEQTGRPFTLLKSPDGISPFSPARLAQAALEDNFAALRTEEEEALRLISQTAPPSVAAQISATQTVTDPIGRLLLGALEQNAAHTAELGTSNVQQSPVAPARTVGTDAARLGVVPPMSDTPPAAASPGVAMAGIVEDTGGGSPVLFWALAIGGLIYSLSTGKKTIKVF